MSVILGVRQLNSKGESTNEKHTLVIFLCHDEFNITRPN